MKVTYFLLFLDVVFAACGQLLLKKGMQIMGPLDLSGKSIIYLITNIFKNIYIVVALFCFGFDFMLWLFVISKLKLSLAYPITAALYILIVFGSWLFFKEDISSMQLVGVSIIFVGLVVLLKSTS